MTRERPLRVVSDIFRVAPLAAVVLATAICVPSLIEFMRAALAPTSMLERLFIALALSYLGVRVLAHLIARYAIRNAAATESEITIEPLTEEVSP